MNRIAKTIFVIAALAPKFGPCQVCVRRISVPDYPPIAVAAQWSGVVNVTIKVGIHGEVVNVEGSGAYSALVDHTKENVKDWVFCDPRNDGSAHVRLRYDYRIKGARVYPVPPARVVIDLGSGTIVITSAPPKVEE